MKHYPTMEGFTDRLDEKIYESGLQIKQVASRCGISRNTLYDIINGYTMPNACVLAKMCKVLHVSADYMLFGEEENE